MERALIFKGWYMMRIAAVVVTYNRKKLLIECLEALRKQTRFPDTIYIIDDASTNGTPLTTRKKHIKFAWGQTNKDCLCAAWKRTFAEPEKYFNNGYSWHGSWKTPNLKWQSRKKLDYDNPLFHYPLKNENIYFNLRANLLRG